MRSYERLSEPAPNVLLIMGLAIGLWAVIGIAAVGVWPRRPGPPVAAGPKIAVEAGLPSLAYLPVLPALAESAIGVKPPPAVRKTKAKTRKRNAPSLAMRFFSARNSVN